MLGLRQRIEDARETLTRALARRRLRRVAPTYEEAVAKVLEEDCSGLYGQRATVVHCGDSFWVEANSDVEGSEYSDVHQAARAFVAIERGEA